MILKQTLMNSEGLTVIYFTLMQNMSENSKLDPTNTNQHEFNVKEIIDYYNKIYYMML